MSIEEIIKIAKETAWMHQGKAGKNIADYMIKTMDDKNLN